MELFRYLVGKHSSIVVPEVWRHI